MEARNEEGLVKTVTYYQNSSPDDLKPLLQKSEVDCDLRCLMCCHDNVMGQLQRVSDRGSSHAVNGRRCSHENSGVAVGNYV